MLEGPIRVAKIEACGCVYDTIVASIGSLVDTSIAGHCARNQIPFSLCMFEQEILCIMCKLYVGSSCLEVSDLC